MRYSEIFKHLILRYEWTRSGAALYVGTRDPAGAGRLNTLHLLTVIPIPLMAGGDDAVAAHIVLTHNAHEELVEALKQTQAALLRLSDVDIQQIEAAPALDYAHRVLAGLNSKNDYLKPLR